MTGTVRPIVRYGAPVLHRACAEVTSFDAELATLIDDMFASMEAAEGVGLAANQVDVALRVFVFDCTDADERRVVGHVVNPVLEAPVGEDRVLDVEGEGCLSVPGEYADLARPSRAVVTGVDKSGKPVRYEGTGMLARCLQHEADHLDGIVYVDRLPRRQRKKVLEAAGFSL